MTKFCAVRGTVCGVNDYDVLMEKINSDKREGRNYNAAISPQRCGMTTTLEEAAYLGVDVSDAPVGSVAVFERGRPVRFECT